MMSDVAQSAECVVLLHGLARTADSMTKLENRLVSEGYVVTNVDYPSRKHSVEVLADIAVEQGIGECEKREASKINLITSNMQPILRGVAA